MSDPGLQRSPFTLESHVAPETGRARGRIFISYRREDSSGHVLALLTPLHDRFGADRVFKDTDGIKPGQDFVEVLQRELASCSVMLVMIGREWLTITDPRFKTRRLDDPQDFLRMEVATALKDERVLVVPVLVARATMPSADELPDELQPLARRHAIELTDSHWKTDVNNLIGVIEKAIDAPRDSSLDGPAGSGPLHGSREPGPLFRALRRVAIAGALLVIVALAGLWWSSGRRIASPDVTATPPKVDVPESVGTTLNVDTSRAQRVADLRARASSAHKERKLPEALHYVREGLSVDAQDRELGSLLTTMLQEAREDISRSEGQARAARAPERAATLFKQASGEKAEGEMWLPSQPDRALAPLWAASKHFDEAAARAKQGGKPAETTSRANQDGAGRQPDGTNAGLVNRKPPDVQPPDGTNAEVVNRKPPDARPPDGTNAEVVNRKPPEIQPPDVTASDRHAIEAVLEEFRLAYNRKDTSGILRVYPDAQADAMIRRVKSCASVNLTFGSKRVELLSNGLVQVEMQSTYGCRANTGQGDLTVPPVPDTFQLERRGAAWVIVRRLVPM